jgi:hypothetical protein
MARRIFNVADTFAIRGRGVVLLPGLVPVSDERFRVGDPLLLKRPDGTELGTWIGGMELFSGTTEVPVLLTGLSKKDVPVGTKVWSVNAAAAGKRSWLQSVFGRGPGR